MMLTLTTARLLRLLCVAALVAIEVWVHPLRECIGVSLWHVLRLSVVGMIGYLSLRIRDLK